jgi:hypothetical protein
MDLEATETLSTLVNLVTVIILFITIREMRKATYATAFKTVYDILQVDEIRAARGTVLRELGKKPFEAWTETERQTAEKVGSSFDTVGIMVSQNYVPENLVLDHWGTKLRQTWPILEPLIKFRREREDSPELWDDYERLALKARDRKRQRLSAEFQPAADTQSSRT